MAKDKNKKDKKDKKDKDGKKSKKDKTAKSPKSAGKSKGSKPEQNSRIRLDNVRLSFPNVFKRAQFEGKEGKFEATFLIPKESKAGKKLKALIDKAIEEAISNAKGVTKIKKENYCIKDGDDSEYEEYEGNWSIKASSNKRPTVLDKDRSAVTLDDEVIYAGCRVNAIIDIWIQNNSYGKRVNSNLYGIQFVKDDEPFGMGTIDVSDEFDDIGDDDDL